ncbi:MAG TPA: hypothetical protein PLO65_01525 [Caulobacter sp.]|nr:hypothetical protein [Caulobacter sp.]
MRLWILISLFAALVLPDVAAARAADTPLTREALLTLLKTDQVWCSGWRDSDQSCEDIAFIDMLPGDKVRQVSRYRMSAEPNLEMVVRETVSLEGGELCSTFRFNDLEIVVLMDNQPAPIEQAAPILAILAQSMAHLEGKKSCEAYVRDEATGDLKAHVTLDGESAPEFDSIYRLIRPDTRILLRPMFENDEQSTTV